MQRNTETEINYSTLKKEVQVVFLVKKISTTDCVGNGLHKSTWHMWNLYKYHKTYGGIAVCEDTE